MNSPVVAPIELPRGYYLENFTELTRHVVDSYGDLLSPQELGFYHTFQQLSRSARYLYLRMLMRKGDLFRSAKLQYDEVDDRPAAARELQSRGLILVDPPLSLEQCLPLFNKAEWLQWLRGQGLPDARWRALKGARREVLDEALRETVARRENPLFTAPESILQLLQVDVFQLFKLLYFGNPHQDLTEFVLRDLHITRFENYSLSRATRRFNCRQQIDRYLEFYRHSENLADILQADAATMLAFWRQLPEPLVDDQRLQRKLEKVVLQLARQLERLQHTAEAARLYRLCDSPPARERRARILAAAGDARAALDLCAEIIAAPRHEQEQEFARNFALRTAKKHRLQGYCSIEPGRRHQPAETLMTLPASAVDGAESQCVEIRVAEALAGSGSCFYVENCLFTGVFGLIFWDVIFAPVAGAFSHPFQFRPHDLYEPDFLDLRHRQLLAVEHSQLQAGANGYLSPQPVIRRFREKYGIANSLVVWPALSEELLQLALQRIPADHWRMLFARLWGDLKSHRSGLPDLILFPRQGGYRLLEVKAPGDRLQDNQRRWMSWFARQDIPHEVVRVEWR